MSQDAEQPAAVSSRDVGRWFGGRGLAGRVLLVCLLAAMAGCAGIAPSSPDVPDIAVPEPEPEQPVPEPPAEPPAEPVIPDEVRPTKAKTAIVMSDRSPAFESVAIELGKLVADVPIYNLADKSQAAEAAFASIAASDADIVIAIGSYASEAAAMWSSKPVVYCQVFNFQTDAAIKVAVRGVSALPPLSAQLEAWKELDPQLRRVGAILGDGHDSLIAEATMATRTNNIEFQHQSARSDRETLYHFTRMAPQIDGFWLFPDNRILSMPVLRQLLEVAARHRVRIAVFNDALLELGVSLSTTAVDSDIASTLVDVANRIANGEADSVPDLTPLSEVKVRASQAFTDNYGAASQVAGSAAKGKL